MATKSTHKKQKYNKRQKQDLAVKLDKIAQKVSKRGAYVVTRNATDDFFIIIEALNKKVVLTHILQKNTAQGLCVRLNSRNRPDSPYEPATEMQMTRTQKLLNRYADLFTESIFHKYTEYDCPGYKSSDAFPFKWKVGIQDWFIHTRKGVHSRVQ